MIDTISIHAPHEGERLPHSTLPATPQAIFQSTLPTRGSDVLLAHGWGLNVNISIHAPHEGERRVRTLERPALNAFQSTLPTRGSEGPFQVDDQQIVISIHAPHEGERLRQAVAVEKHKHFNPRSPRGGATKNLAIPLRPDIFQSTLPTRGSDARVVFLAHAPLHISIHAPHEGERLADLGVVVVRVEFQSTLPTRGSDERAQPHQVPRGYFNPRSPRGGATPERAAAHTRR